MHFPVEFYKKELRHIELEATKKKIHDNMQHTEFKDLIDRWRGVEVAQRCRTSMPDVAMNLLHVDDAHMVRLSLGSGCHRPPTFLRVRRS